MNKVTLTKPLDIDIKELKVAFPEYPYRDPIIEDRDLNMDAITSEAMHKYEALITRELFQCCESIRRARNRTQSVRNTKYPFIFRGLLSWAVTGKRLPLI